MNPILVGVSLFATLLSTISYLSMPGEILGKGPAGLLTLPGMLLVYFIVAYLILPLYMPVLIFGSGAVDAAASGNPAGPYLALIGAMLCLAAALAPFATAAGLRISVDA